MARIVQRILLEPARYVIDGKEVWLRRCGLSKNQPFCDRSYKLARGEASGKFYWYDNAGTRHEVAETFAGMRTY